MGSDVNLIHSAHVVNTSWFKICSVLKQNFRCKHIAVSRPNCIVQFGRGELVIVYYCVLQRFQVVHDLLWSLGRA